MIQWLSFGISATLGILAVIAYMIQFSSFRKVRREDIKEQGKKEKEFETMQKDMNNFGDVVRRIEEKLNIIENKVTEIDTKIDGMKERLERNENAIDNHIANGKGA